MNLFRSLRNLVAAGVRITLAAPIPWLRLAAGGGVCLVGGSAAAFALRPDLWMVEQITFSGGEHIRAAELRHLMDLPNGTLIWSIQPNVVAEALERHPWVRQATVSVTFPDTLQVEIAERTAVALLHDGEHLLYVDQEGTPFLPADFRTGAPVDLDLVHLTGMGSELTELHPELAPRAIRDALWLIHTLDERTLVPAGTISEVSFSRTGGFTVVAPPSRVLFGLSDLPTQVDRLGRLVSNGLSLDEPRHVDLAPPTVAIVRPLVSAGGHPPASPPSGGG